MSGLRQGLHRAISARGAPGDLVLPDQLIDYTGGRYSTFFDGEDRNVVHVDFTHPYSSALRGRCLAAARAVVSNDSGLLHVAAALGKSSVGIFGPTSPWHWAPLNPLSGIIEAQGELPCRPCHKPVCRPGHHRCMRDIAADRVFLEVQRAAAANDQLCDLV